jgi:cell division protein FtsB
VKLRTRTAALVALPLLGALVGLGTWRGVVEVRDSLREMEQLEAHCVHLRDANEKLLREVEALKREREVRIHAARETLDVVAPGEVLVLVTDQAPPHERGSAPATPAAAR